MKKNKCLKRYKSVDEMFADMEREAKEHPIREFFFTLWCHITNIFWNNPKDFYRGIKWFIQRGKRGYADCDLWNFEYYLANVIEKGVGTLHKEAHGFFVSDDIKTLEQWQDVLLRIQRTFHIAKLIANGNWDYIPSYKWTDQLFTEHKKLFKNRDIVVMDFQTVRKYEEGFDLFKKYFIALND